MTRFHPQLMSSICQSFGEGHISRALAQHEHPAERLQQTIGRVPRKGGGVRGARYAEMLRTRGDRSAVTVKFESTACSHTSLGNPDATEKWILTERATKPKPLLSQCAQNLCPYFNQFPEKVPWQFVLARVSGEGGLAVKNDRES